MLVVRTIVVPSKFCRPMLAGFYSLSTPTAHVTRYTTRPGASGTIGRPSLKSLLILLLLLQSLSRASLLVSIRRRPPAPASLSTRPKQCVRRLLCLRVLCVSGHWLETLFVFRPHPLTPCALHPRPSNVDHIPQYILISGESGGGKTECSKVGWLACGRAQILGPTAHPQVSYMGDMAAAAIARSYLGRRTF